MADKQPSLAALIVQRWKAKKSGNTTAQKDERGQDMGKELLEAIESKDAAKFARLLNDFNKANSG